MLRCYDRHNIPASLRADLDNTVKQNDIDESLADDGREILARLHRPDESPPPAMPSHSIATLLATEIDAEVQPRAFASDRTDGVAGPWLSPVRQRCSHWGGDRSVPLRGDARAGEHPIPSSKTSGADEQRCSAGTTARECRSPRNATAPSSACLPVRRPLQARRLLGPVVPATAGRRRSSSDRRSRRSVALDEEQQRVEPVAALLLRQQKRSSARRHAVTSLASRLSSTSRCASRDRFAAQRRRSPAGSPARPCP